MSWPVPQSLPRERRRSEENLELWYGETQVPAMEAKSQRMCHYPEMVQRHEKGQMLDRNHKPRHPQIGSKGSREVFQRSP